MKLSYLFQVNYNEDFFHDSNSIGAFKSIYVDNWYKCVCVSGFGVSFFVEYFSKKKYIMNIY